MGLIVDAEVSAEEFVLGEALRGEGVEAVEFERVVPVRRRELPLLWAWAEDFAAFERAASRERALEEIRPVERVEGGRLYWTQWSDHVTSLGAALCRADATFLRGVGEDSRWRFVFKFPLDGDPRAFADHCQERGVPLSVERVSRLRPPEDDPVGSLTPKQREILQVASRRGYFEEPRSVSLEDLGDDLGISAPSASGRLRRAILALVEATVDAER